MLSYENPQVRAKNLPTALLVCLALIFMIFPSIASAENHPCKKSSINLRGDLDVVMNRGGLWSLMEQTEGLQDKSLLGIKADGKLARAVGQFETLCDSEKKPTKQLFENIQNLLGEARIIFNPRSSGKKIIELISNLNKKLDTLLTKIE